MKTNKHLLSASNILLSLSNDKTLTQSQKISVIQTIDSMVIALFVNLLDERTAETYKEKVIDVLLEYNKETETEKI